MFFSSDANCRDERRLNQLALVGDIRAGQPMTLGLRLDRRFTRQPSATTEWSDGRRTDDTRTTRTGHSIQNGDTDKYSFVGRRWQTNGG